MKLLHVIGSMNPQTGGPCQTIRNFAPHFLEQGHALDVVCLDDPHSDFLKSDPFSVHALGQGRGAWNYHPALRPWLEERLPQYDAAILNGLWQYQGYALSQAAKKANAAPYYIFPHGMLDPWFQRLSVRPVKALRNWFLWKVMMQRVVHDAAGLLFTCEEERRLARMPFRPYAPKQEAVVGLGLPEPPAYDARMKEAFYKKCPGLEGRDYLLFLGRIHPKKGVDLLIQAYANLCRSSEVSALPRLVLAGPGLDSAYGQKVQQLAAACPRGSVFWPGMLTGDAKWGATYHCEAFVLPSHQENFGIAVVEALACGKPVLISDQVNIWREIKEAGAALVHPNTVEAISGILRDWTKLSADDTLGLAGRAKPCFRNCFSIESATRKLLDATTQVTQCKRQQPIN